MSFSDDLNRIAKKTNSSLDQVRRAVILELFSSVIKDSPVDTGRFKGNWQTTIGNAATGNIGIRGESTAISEISRNLGELGSVVFMANNLPYSHRLEYDGWSGQAPNGMVRKNMIRVESIVRRKAAEVNK